MAGNDDYIDEGNDVSYDDGDGYLHYLISYTIIFNHELDERTRNRFFLYKVI